MKRRALLIESAKVKGLDHLPGAEADIRNYQQYLCSITGGCWQQAEIRTLSKPSRSRLLSEIQSAESEVDYLFLSFSGHGYMKRPPNLFPRPTDKQLTMLCLNDSEEVSIADINPAIKNFLIADSCKGLKQVVEKAMAFAESLSDSMRSIREDLARRLFDEQVRVAESGQILTYSCGINESAGENKNSGGCFSSAMMECGIVLAHRGSTPVITTDEVFEAACRMVKSSSAQQNPEYSAGRRLLHFPFAVHV